MNVCCLLSPVTSIWLPVLANSVPGNHRVPLLVSKLNSLFPGTKEESVGRAHS
jgi:hypothetical protein